MLDLAAEQGHVRSADGTPIAWWRYRGAEPVGEGAEPSRSPGPRCALLLVHGTTADHTTFRVVGPRFAASRPTFALDRRGREASGDTDDYDLEREFEDVAAVADRLAIATGRPVDILGHSYGGRCAMGAAQLTPSIRRIVSYEGAVPAGVGTGDLGLLRRLERLEAEDRHEELLRVFLTEVVELTPAEWDAFRTSPVWAARLAAAHTVVRELRAGSDDGAAWERYASLPGPVLQLLGSESAAFFRIAAEALDARLEGGRIAVIEGARHAAHHTHPDRFLGLVEGFLDEPAASWPQPAST